MKWEKSVPRNVEKGEKSLSFSLIPGILPIGSESSVTLLLK